VIVYGLDWVATVPPTVALCREQFGDGIGPIVFGWIFAAHQIGAAIAAVGAGTIRDTTGSYSGAFWTAALLCLVAAALSAAIPRARDAAPEPVG
jgi:predicted MFS family arabinose efflux permease